MQRGRRRPYEDDESGGNRYFKRPRTALVQEKKEEDPIKAVIFHVGENTKIPLEASIESAVTTLDAELATQKSKILQLLLEAVTTLPEKCSIYSTLAGLLNHKNYNFGGEFVESLVKSFKEHLRNGAWSLAQYTLRFISDLVNCHVVSATSLLQLYDTFMEGAADTSAPQVRRDWLVYAILNCLPWVGRELFDKKEQTVERLMITIDNYMKRRNRAHHALLRVWSSDDPNPQEEYLDCLWAQIENLKMNGWLEKHIARPYISFDSVLCEALQHNLPQIILPPHHENMRYPTPSVVFRIFDYADCGEEYGVLPGAHSIERFLIEQELTEILRKHHKDRRECAIALLDYPLTLQHSTKVPIDYMIVEVIFGQLFKLPVPEYLEICYGSLLIELCKKQPGSVPQVLAQTTELLYERLDSMNASCIDRFATWFSYHLSNFQFRWSWVDWQSALSLDPEHPKPKFISEVLAKCVRLSYYERISELFPKTMSALLPLPAEPLYKFDVDKVQGNIPGLIQSKNLTTAFREKQPVEEMLVILQDVPNPLEGDSESPTHNPLAIEVFSQTLFMLGSKSLTHAHAAISKYQPIFKLILDNEEAQLCVLKAAFEVWKLDTQMLAVVVDMLLKYQIVDCSAVANWVFMKDMTGEFTKIYLWEILHLTIRKMNKHVSRMATELAEAREKLRRAEMNSSDSEEDGDGSEKDKESKDDVPTEDQVDKMEEKLEAAQADQKNLFLIVFQRFIMILSEHIARCDTDGKNFNTPWYRWTIGRLQQVFMQHAEQVAQYSSTLETLLFTQDLDKNILEIFHQFQALRA